MKWLIPNAVNQQNTSSLSYINPSVSTKNKQFIPHEIFEKILQYLSWPNQLTMSKTCHLARQRVELLTDSSLPLFLRWFSSLDNLKGKCNCELGISLLSRNPQILLKIMQLAATLVSKRHLVQPNSV